MRFFFFLSASVDQRAHGPMLLSHSLTYLSLPLVCLRVKTLTRGVQMCETFYCESGQTSQISGKFYVGCFGFQNLKESECLLIVVQMEEQIQNQVIDSPD